MSIMTALPCRLKGKVVLIVGLSSDIGSACAHILQEQGCIIVGTTTKEESLAGAFKLLHLDFTEKGSIDALILRLASLNLKPQIIINNAGLGLDPAPLSAVDYELLLRIFNINALMPCELIRRMLKHFCLEKIVNIGSIMSELPLPYYGAYSGAKGAFLNLTMSLRYELKAKGIDVCAVLPNLTKTQFINKRIHINVNDKELLAKCAYIENLNKSNQKKADDPYKAAAAVVRALKAQHSVPVYYVGAKGYISSFITKVFPKACLYRIVTKLFKL